MTCTIIVDVVMTVAGVSCSQFVAARLTLGSRAGHSVVAPLSTSQRTQLPTHLGHRTVGRVVAALLHWDDLIHIGRSAPVPRQILRRWYWI